MKAILQFDMSDPQDTRLHKEAINGSVYKEALRTIDDKLRDMVKYEDKVIVKVDDVRSMFRDILYDLDITLWDD